MIPHDANSLEQFLQDASERIQLLRECGGLPIESQSPQEDLARLHEAAHALMQSAATAGFPLFSEIASKLAHVFQYARNTELSPDTCGPLTEFLADAVTVLEFDILQIVADGQETVEDIAAFKHRYAFAFPAAVAEAEPIVQSGEVPVSESLHAEIFPDDDEVPKEVLDFFVPEAEEHLHVATQCLLTLESNPSADEIHRLFRSVHTIKGSAAQVGLRRLSTMAHRLEDLIGQLRDGAMAPSAEIVEVCLQAVDVLRKFLQQDWTSDEEMYAAVAPLLARISEWAPAEQSDEAADAPHAAIVTNSQPDAAPEHSANESFAAPATAARVVSAKSVRISLQRLDQMMNGVGELVINRTRLVGRMAELKKLVEVLGLARHRLTNKVSEFQDKYEFNQISRGIFDANSSAQRSADENGNRTVLSVGANGSEFSELEMDRYDDVNILARSLAEISADVSEVVSQLGGFVGRVGMDINEFTKLAHHLQDGLTQARMVPIGNLYTRLSRTARDAAKVCGKPVELVEEGAETQLDNNIVQQITDPLIHLVRNAVAHGIESAEDRERAGKPARGRITVRAFHRGNQVYIEIEDDGRGLDYERIYQCAVQAGLISTSDSERPTERELRAFLFHPGFTTAAAANEIAGRGVGLDVVRNNVHALNGEIEIRSQAGKGTCFAVKVPLTLIISQALFIRSGATTLAMPLAVVEEIRRVRPEEIEDVGGKLLTKVRGVVTEVIRLDTALGLAPLEPVNGFFRMIVVHVIGRQVGVIVEEVLGKDEVVIKNLGEYLRRVKLFPGATISSDGSLILLLDVNRLVAGDTSERNIVVPSASAARVFAPGAAAVASGSIPAAVVDELRGEKVVVVADDSISVRKFVGRMLEKAGYRVRLASDGLEASEIIAQVGCHLLVTDIEMPRMNGYELMTHLRQDAATRRIPVLVVTSRAGAKHRDRAMKEGAASFLTKPVQEDQLLSVVEKLIGTVEERSHQITPAFERA
jgi:chemosensory pili system protein ChpA (sensor histidine kinase/response regulator)